MQLAADTTAVTGLVRHSSVRIAQVAAHDPDPTRAAATTLAEVPQGRQRWFAIAAPVLLKLAARQPLRHLRREVAVEHRRAHAEVLGDCFGGMTGGLRLWAVVDARDGNVVASFQPTFMASPIPRLNPCPPKGEWTCASSPGHRRIVRVPSPRRVIVAADTVSPAKHISAARPRAPT
jgi:hypothetical protein